LIRNTHALVLALAAVAAACASTPDGPPPSPEELFAAAEREAVSGGLFGGRDCFAAEAKIEELRRRYPYHGATIEGELILAACAYDDGREPEAIGRWEAFVRLYPSHAKVPHVLDRLGDAYMGLYDDYDRDLGPVHQALASSEQIVRNHATSPEVDAALIRRTQARTILATRELYVADFYRKSGHLLSARSRYLRVVDLYGDLDEAAAAREALARVERRLNLPAAAAVPAGAVAPPAGVNTAP